MLGCRLAFAGQTGRGLPANPVTRLCIVEEVRSLLSAEGGKVVLNRATGTLAVTDSPARVQQVGEYLAALESRSRAGVMIETRIFEITLDDTSQYGINRTAFPA